LAGKPKSKSRITYRKETCRICHTPYYACQSKDRRSKKRRITLSDSVKFCPDCQFERKLSRKHVSLYYGTTKTLGYECSVRLHDLIAALPPKQEKAVLIFLRNESWYARGRRIGTAAEEKNFYRAVERLRAKCQENGTLRPFL